MQVLRIHGRDNKLLKIFRDRDKRPVDQDISGIDAIDMVYIYYVRFTDFIEMTSFQEFSIKL